MAKDNFDNEKGVWRTIGGRRVFIRNGQSLSQAMIESGKFKNAKRINNKKDDIKSSGKIGEVNDKGNNVEKRVAEETRKVEERASNELKPFKKQEMNEKVEKEVTDRGGELTEEQVKECLEVADKVYKEAELHEPQISRDLIDSANKTNSKMYGLDFRMKQPGSMAGKIASDAKEDGISFKEAGSNIKDAVRYTMIVDEKDFVNKYNKIKTNLEAKGYKEVRLKNFYQMYEDNMQCQKAIQCVYADKEGYLFELQYHTKNSQGAKELNHPLYEEYRKKGTSENRKKELYNQMREIGLYVKNPEDILKIKSHN